MKRRADLPSIAGLPGFLRLVQLIGLTGLLVATACAPSGVRVGSKRFTESRILGELGVHFALDAGASSARRVELGGTILAWEALLSGAIDLYPEYSGTLAEEILSGQHGHDLVELERVLAERGIRMTAPLGFNNTYALGMRADRAAELGIRRISDLLGHPDLALGFSNEFMSRGDGWPALRAAYELPHQDVRGLDHSLAYRALDSGSIDVMDLYSTDAEIRYYGLAVVEDDRAHFPRYDALFLYREELDTRLPELTRALESLAGRISPGNMLAMNARAKLDRVPAQEVAADFAGELGIRASVVGDGLGRRLLRRTGEHLFLVLVSLGAAIAVAVPLGVLGAKRRRLGRAILAVAGVVQTIPSLALLVFTIPLLKLLGVPAAHVIGALPAILALFLYGLLPIVRNTYVGIADIPRPLAESALALGLPARTRLLSIELPLASRAILAGIKTSAVINVGTATLGALIGAGGYGQPILTGLTLDDTGLILEGAIPAAVLALIVQGLFDASERLFVPRGLRHQG